MSDRGTERYEVGVHTFAIFDLVVCFENCQCFYEMFMQMYIYMYMYDLNNMAKLLLWKLCMCSKI